MHTPKKVNLHVSQSQCPTHKAKKCCIKPFDPRYTKRKYTLLFSSEKGTSVKANSQFSFLNGKKQMDFCFRIMTVLSCSKKVSKETQKDVNSSQLTVFHQSRQLADDKKLHYYVL